jgi:tyrosyl-tRNA synthetase
MYGKTMAIPDEAMAEYRRLLLAGHAIAGESVPQPSRLGIAKRALARALVAWLYSAAGDAAAAEEHFDRVFVQREAPEEIDEASFEGEDGMLHLPGLIAERVRDVALGGAPPDRPGRRDARRASRSRRASTTSRASVRTARC